MKKTISILLSAAVTISSVCMPIAAFADEETTVNQEDSKYTMPTGAQGSGEKSDSKTETAVTEGNKANTEYTLPTSGDKTSAETDDTQNSGTKTDDKDTRDENKDSSVDTEKDSAQPVLSEEKSNKISVSFKMIPRMQVIDSFAVIELCDKNGKAIAEKSEWVGGITETLNFEFEVPEYNLGEKFVLKLKDGLTYLKYYDKAYGKGDPIELETYYYKDDNNNDVYGNSFAFDACPLYEHVIVLYVEGQKTEFSPKPRLIDDTAMVPLRATAEKLGFDVRYDERYNSVVCSIGDKQMLFNVGTSYATIFGNDIYMSKECMMIDSTVFVPARSFADAAESSIEAIDFGDHIDVCIGKSQKADEYLSSIPVNKWGLSSKTNYLVWIDKSDYRVRVYTGSQYKWKPAASFPCAIGAPSTPTITGSFEYLYRVAGWYYDGYYVGPCLVFYGGYALHSTLLRYDNTPYDNRVETMISHGCVRLHKSDIDWIAARLPIGSRIYVTE